ncbi:hypothetical protein TSTA_081940 [Talaromyces stipitatus ATCC 10500]|uniref:Uncharacterized protein n=1 Tax=Talaromyces stipitatus (strain ATCC 10500 / CBS 375.48 / QM 6759 / NRRL 1006) TaxID=441959 RepID=B8M029_TALSN|nr:uncharacterized protein TSTA_081940 [Talaromyces stipitatus ATCC 10500]EED20961.1 hypothetical protein TSTA_081940 [Talaromyces stipitatus ATCC 10500]
MLRAAAAAGYPKIVQQLLKNGANINAQGGNYGNALQASAEGGHLEVIQLLLEKGADVNTLGGFCGNAIQAVS